MGTLENTRAELQVVGSSGWSCWLSELAADTDTDVDDEADVMIVVDDDVALAVVDRPSPSSSLIFTQTHLFSHSLHRTYASIKQQSTP